MIRSMNWRYYRGFVGVITIVLVCAWALSLVIERTKPVVIVAPASSSAQSAATGLTAPFDQTAH